MSENVRQFDAIFVQNYGNFVAYCRQSEGVRFFEAEDIVHLTYIKCRRSWRAERQSRIEKTAYIYRALRWIISDIHARESRRRELERRSARPLIEIGTGQPGQPTAWDEAQSSLTGRQKDICSALIRGMSRREIQQEFQMSAGAVYTAICRCRRRLVAELLVDGNELD